MKAKIIAIVVVVLAAAVAGGIATRMGHAGSASSSSPDTKKALSLLSGLHGGTPVTLPGGDPRTASFNYRNLAQVGAQGRTTFFTAEKANGERCYAVGSTGASWPLGAVTCRDGAPYFPSAQVPTLDLSVYELNIDGSGGHYLNVRGFAADGVAAINALSSSGQVLARIPVQNNVYEADSAPDGTTQLVPIDASGTALG